MNSEGFGATWAGFDVTIGEGGTANLKKLALVTQGGNTSNSSVTLQEGGRLNLGSGGYVRDYGYHGTAPTKGMLSLNLNGGTLGALDSWSAASSVVLNIGGNSTIDTTKAGSTEGATITLSGALSGTGKLTVDGAGTLALGGTVASGVTITNNGTVSLADSVIFDLTGTGTHTLISGTGTVEGRDALSKSNLRINGEILGGRQTATFADTGTVTVSEFVAANLVWNGGASGTWNTATGSTVWLNGDAEDAFYTLDNVEFTDALAGTVSVAAEIDVGDLRVSSGTHMLTSASSGYVAIHGSATVEGRATLILGTSTGSTGLLRGAITVKDGGRLQFNAKDVTGYSGGTSSLQTITVESGGVLHLNHGDNETFCGTLNLNGTLSGNENSQWDFFGGSAKIVVADGENAKVDVVKLNLRQNDSVVSVGADAALTINSGVVSTTEGNGTLVKQGSGTLTFSSGSQSTFTTCTASAGTTNFNGTATLTTLSQTAGTLNVSSATTISGNYTGGNNSASTINVQTGGDLNVQGNFTLHQEYNQLSTLNVAGTMKVGGELWIARDGMGDINVNDGSTLAVGSVTATTTLNTPSLNLNGGTLGTTADSLTIGVAGLPVVLGDGTTSTVKTSKFENGTFGDTAVEITISDVVSGSGALTADGAGTLTLSGENKFSGGVEIAAGVVKATNAAALGAGTVAVSGGQLEIGSGVTLNNTAITIALSSAHGNVAAIIGEGSLDESTRFTLTNADAVALDIATEQTTKTYQIFESDSSFVNTFSADSFTLGDGWDSGW